MGGQPRVTTCESAAWGHCSQGTDQNEQAGGKGACEHECERAYARMELDV